jgi:hypothetical protein
VEEEENIARCGKKNISSHDIKKKHISIIHSAVGSKAASEATMTATLKLKKMTASEATMTATLKLKR